MAFEQLTHRRTVYNVDTSKPILGGIMNRMLFTFLLLALFGSVLIAGDALTLEEAKKLSAETNKPLLLDFFTEW
jgi:hypothetical protein